MKPRNAGRLRKLPQDVWKYACERIE